METVQSVSSKFFEIKLSQSKSGTYYVSYMRRGDEEATMSEPMKDLRVALSVFEIKLIELEGH